MYSPELGGGGPDVLPLDYFVVHTELVQDRPVHQGPHQVQRYDAGQGVQEDPEHFKPVVPVESKPAFALQQQRLVQRSQKHQHQPREVAAQSQGHRQVLLLGDFLIDAVARHYVSGQLAEHEHRQPDGDEHQPAGECLQRVYEGINHRYSCSPGRLRFSKPRSPG